MSSYSDFIEKEDIQIKNFFKYFCDIILKELNHNEDLKKAEFDENTPISFIKLKPDVLYRYFKERLSNVYVINNCNTIVDIMYDYYSPHWSHSNENRKQYKELLSLMMTKR